VKKSYLFLTAIASLGLGIAINATKPISANAKSKYPAIYRKINNLKWKHPYDGSDDFYLENSKGKDIQILSGQGLRDEKYNNYIKTRSLPKLIRGRWYLSRKNHFSIGKNGLNKKLVRYNDPTASYFNLSKQRYTTFQATYFTYFHHPRKTRKTYIFSAYNSKAGMQSYISTDMQPLTIKTSSGKKYSALAIEYYHNGRTTERIAYHKYHAKLPHSFALLYYGDYFGTWSSPTTEKINFGKTVSVSSLKKDTRQALAHEDGTINFQGGGDQILQYLTKIDKKHLSPEVISTLKSYS